jgi:DNA-binding transcriptional LysR family regulator
MPQLDPTSLRLFVHVVEAGTIAGAAASSHIAAAAVSKRVSELESLLGVTLLQRTNRGVQPTEAGTALLDLARDALHALDRIPTRMSSFSALVEGTLKVRASFSAIGQFLPSAIRRFQQRYPSVRLELAGGTSTEVVQALREREIDIGIYAGDIDTGDLETYPCFGDRLVLICSEAHALSQYHDIDFAQALRFDFVGSISATAIDRLLLLAATDAGMPLNVTTRVGGFEPLCSLVEEGVGLGVLPEAIALRHARALRIRLIQLRDPWALRQFTVAVSSWAELSAAGRRFLADLQSDAST